MFKKWQLRSESSNSRGVVKTKYKIKLSPLLVLNLQSRSGFRPLKTSFPVQICKERVFLLSLKIFSPGSQTYTFASQNVQLTDGLT